MAENTEFLEVDNVIYEAAETTTRPTAQRNDPQKIPPDRRRYKWVGVGLLVAVLALLNVAVPLYLCQSNTVEREQLLNNYNQLLDNLTRERDQSLDRIKNLTEERDQLLDSNNKLTIERDQSLDRINTLTRERDQSLDRINTLTRERDQSLDRINKLTRERDSLKRRLCDQHGFTFGGGLCYYISTEKKSWTESRKWCTDRNSDLIVIKSKEKQDFVERFNKNVWLGLTDRVREGSFQWVDGAPLTTPTYWRSDGQPNNHEGDQDCVYFYSRGVPAKPKGWNDAQCSPHVEHWMCERVLY